MIFTFINCNRFESDLDNNDDNIDSILDVACSIKPCEVHANNTYIQLINDLREMFFFRGIVICKVFRIVFNILTIQAIFTSA